MFQYQFVQWLLFFYVYCFIGWCIESTYVSLHKKKWVNRGFMRGPFLPIYGSGAIMMLFVSRPFQENLILVFLAGMVGATVLEYVTGVCMEALFKVRYWDYSDKRFNFKGHICAGSSLAWGFLTIVMTRVIHRPVEYAVLGIPFSILQPLLFVLTLLFVTDLTLSFRAALDIRDILLKMEHAREEMYRMQKRLDVLIAVSVEAKDEMRSDIESKLDEWKESWESRKMQKDHRMDSMVQGIEERIERLKQTLQEKTAEKQSGVWEELTELLQRLGVHKENRERIRKSPGFQRKRNLLRNNPSMRSVKFKEVLEDLIEAVNDKYKK